MLGEKQPHLGYLATQRRVRIGQTQHWVVFTQLNGLNVGPNMLGCLIELNY